MYRRLGNHETAEDVTAEVFLKVLRGIDTYRPATAPFSTWLYRIAANAVVDYARARRITMSLDVTADAADMGAPVDELAISRVEAARVWQAIDNLTEAQRTAVTMRFGSDLPIADIAGRMGRTVGAVKLLLNRGRPPALLGRWARLVRAIARLCKSLPSIAQRRPSRARSPTAWPVAASTVVLLCRLRRWTVAMLREVHDRRSGAVKNRSAGSASGKRTTVKTATATRPARANGRRAYRPARADELRGVHASDPLAGRSPGTWAYDPQWTVPPR